MQMQQNVRGQPIHLQRFMSRVRRGILDALRGGIFPSARLPYADVEWWDKTYKELNGRHFEWGDMSYDDLKSHRWCPQNESYFDEWRKGTLKSAKLDDESLAGLAKRPGGDLLVLGGGTSHLSREMKLDGWGSILDIDFSPIVVELNKELPILDGLQYATIDARTMRPLSFPDSPRKFDVCIDKGLIDALWCSGTKEGEENIALVAQSVASVLKPHGRFVCLSFSASKVIMPFLLGRGPRRFSPWGEVESRKLKSLHMHMLQRRKHANNLISLKV
jgi:SAM-dependent methyltransferase